MRLYGGPTLNTAPRSAREAQPRRFYASDYRRRLRDAGALATISASANVVLAALCDRANAAGVAWPSVETIGKDYGLGESTVRRALGELVAVGLVLAVRRAGKVSRYVLKAPEEATGTITQAAQDGADPARFERAPLSNRAPIMTNDHLHDHQEQHDSSELAAEVVVVGEKPSGETTAATPPTTAVENEPIDLLPADLVGRVRALGIAPAKVNRHGAERVRCVLAALAVERARRPIASPAGWAMKALAEGWELPDDGVTRSPSAAAMQLPEGTRWARAKETGVELEVLDVNDVRVQLAGDVAVPVHRWSEWEWLVELPGQEPGAEVLVSELAPVGEAIAAGKREVLARVVAWASLKYRTPAELAVKLAAVGVTAEEFEAYRVAQKAE